jgi:hypothetical protein
LLLSCLLLLATGLSLVGLAQTAGPFAVPAAPVESADAAATAQAFYAAVNEVLATGKAAPLDHLVSPGLVEHPPRPGDGGRAGLVRVLLARRAVFPGLRVAVDDARAAGDDLVAIRVRAAGPTAGSFLGMPVPAVTTAWGPVELLRVADGRVAERWTGTGDATMLSPLWEAALPSSESDASAVVALRRITWEPGAELDVDRNPGAWFFLAERGALSLAAGLGPPVPLGSDETETLGPGNLFAVPPGADFAVRNGGTAPAVALVVAIWTPPSVTFPITGQGGAAYTGEREAVALGLGWDARGEVALAPGVTARVLVTAPGVEVPAGATLALGQVALAPGAALSLATEGTLVVALEAGGIEIGAEGGIAWTIDTTGTREEVPGRAAVATGAGAVATTGPVGLWQSGADPAVLLVLAVRPAPG